MLPSMLDWTMRISPFFRATMETWANIWISAGRLGCADRATHNQFNGIAKSGVHQTADGLAKLCRQLLGRKAQQSSERDDGDEVLRDAVSNGMHGARREMRTSTKTAVGLQSRMPAMIPSGTKTSSTLT